MELVHSLSAFMDELVYPNEDAFARHAVSDQRWTPWPGLEPLKEAARAAGLWNLFDKLSNAAYAPLCEIMGRVPWSAEVFNCSAPDSGNMEVLARYGSDQQKARWLVPLQEGKVRSAFAMTEPAVASSDATNIEGSIVRNGDTYVVNGRKWWTSGANDPRCAFYIFMGQSDPENADRHRRQAMIIVPADAAGVTVHRALRVFGFDDAPHGHAEVSFTDVRVPAENIILGEGQGFTIAQGRLGPGRIHHCMRLIGLAERALERMCTRVSSRKAFGKPLAEQTVTLERIAESRVRIDQARLLVLDAARQIDTAGNKQAAAAIAAIKIAAPAMACQVIDWAIQAHGGAGLCDDFGLAYAYAVARALRLADGPDEVHRNQLALMELKKQSRH